MSLNAFKQLTSSTKFSNASKGTFYNTKNKALAMLEGTVEEQYKILDDYCRQLTATNPGSSAFIKSHLRDEKRTFERVYICLEACKQGFKHCRKVIGLDGCFLKGKVKGMLLCAMGTDADNGMFPIAWAVCEKDNTEMWRWFLSFLHADLGLGIEDTRKYTMISDTQKGLENAVGHVFDGAEVRFCVKHLYDNFKKEFPGSVLKQSLWSCAEATTPEEWRKNMLELKQVNEKAYEWLMKKMPSEWTKSHFRFDNKCDFLTNNMCESFNSVILSAREKSILSLLEGVRSWAMSLFCRKRESVAKWTQPVGKRVQKHIESEKQILRYCNTLRASNYKFQVSFNKGIHSEVFVVNLESWECTCRGFQLTGIPCGHALSAIRDSNLNLNDYIHEVYKKETFITQYAPTINPIPSPDKWPNIGSLPLYPPAETVMPGRPKKKRKRDGDEGRPGSKQKKNQPNRCSNCLQIGHKINRCTNPRQEKPPEEKKKMGRPRAVNPKPETVIWNARKMKQMMRNNGETSQASTPL